MSKFASFDGNSTIGKNKDHGIQIIDEEKIFSTQVAEYMENEKIAQCGFNYHLVSVFGSQSTGKSTLLNHLFGTCFGVMSEQDRKQTTKGIWMSKNRNTTTLNTHGDDIKRSSEMAKNILVMDVEGSDGRERGEDQDFERKAALFALATSEILIVNIWEHQVGLYQGANLALLKTVFEVNLQLFVKNSKVVPRSLLLFIIRDHVGNTPLENLKETLLQDLQKIWASISKPANLETSKISDYFDFAFEALPHKLLMPEQFIKEVNNMRHRFSEGYSKTLGSSMERKKGSMGLFLPEYHRRIPADGFSIYAENIWEQIVSNKDLDLPTQQELLAQFRCDEISREVMIEFDELIVPFETKQNNSLKIGEYTILPQLDQAIKKARNSTLEQFTQKGIRYHKEVFLRKKRELEGNVDSRLKVLHAGQLDAAHKLGIRDFVDNVSQIVKVGQKSNASYDFGQIVEEQMGKAIEKFTELAKAHRIDNVTWSNYDELVDLFRKELENASKTLRGEELRRLVARIERAMKGQIDDSIGIEFNFSTENGGDGNRGLNKKGKIDLWDRIWNSFKRIVQRSEERFLQRARNFDASAEEVELGVWRLKRKAWALLRNRVLEELKEGNMIVKLRESFECKFRYDELGVPRVWRPSDDIEGLYRSARESTLSLIPVLSKIILSSTNKHPDLRAWIGEAPQTNKLMDEEEFMTIGGVDDDESVSLEDEMTMLSEVKVADVIARFKKIADEVYVDAKRSAIGGVSQIPVYFYCLLIALGWNEMIAVVRSPLYFIFVAVMGVFGYITYNLNLWGPMLSMADAAVSQAIDIGKKRLRDMLEVNDGGSTRSSAYIVEPQNLETLVNRSRGSDIRNSNEMPSSSATGRNHGVGGDASMRARSQNDVSDG